MDLRRTSCVAAGLLFTAILLAWPSSTAADKARGKRSDTYGTCQCEAGEGEERIRSPRDKPNFVVFFADDMGYGDLASNGHPVQERGPIDDVMIKGGVKFTQGYTPDTVCSPSRTALLTGRYPVRAGVYGGPDHGSRVFMPWSKNGLPRDEVTLAEALKEAGYATGMAGKWHLGINNATANDGAHLPMNHGFDFVGHVIPFTNSMACDETGEITPFPISKLCFLYKRNTIVAQPYNHTYLAQTMVNDAVSFINDHTDDPFFFYFPLIQPHAPVFASPLFAGKSRRGEYGDMINEMSWSVGEVIRTLEDNGLSNNTLVLFMSDHGPHREYCNQGGDPSIFKGYKGHSWEGGVRVPFIAYWPGMITPRESDEIVSTLDVMRTLVDLAGGQLPTDRPYDGENITALLFDDDVPSPHDVLYYYCSDRLMAVRSGPYKVHYYTHLVRTMAELAAQCGPGGQPTRHYFDCGDCYDDCISHHDPPLVYNIELDPIESYPLDVGTNSTLADFMAELAEKVAAHVAGVVPSPPLLDDQDESLAPCCNPETNCICNYGPVDGAYN